MIRRQRWFDEVTEHAKAATECEVLVAEKLRSAQTDWSGGRTVS